MSEKYTYADISPGRLAEIKAEFAQYGKPNGQFSTTTTHFIVRDLLAMVAVRDKGIEALAKIHGSQVREIAEVNSRLIYERSVLFSTEDKLRDARDEITALREILRDKKEVVPE